MGYLREVRLRRAHALSAADRDATTVRAIAASVGMLHPSRFGATPSDTLNRPSDMFPPPTPRYL
jgi:hypothetical protein